MEFRRGGLYVYTNQLRLFESHSIPLLWPNDPCSLHPDAHISPRELCKSDKDAFARGLTKKKKSGRVSARARGRARVYIYAQRFSALSEGNKWQRQRREATVYEGKTPELVTKKTEDISSEHRCTISCTISCNWLPTHPPPCPAGECTATWSQGLICFSFLLDNIILKEFEAYVALQKIIIKR